MKRLLLFLVFVAQISFLNSASAFYDPSIGRWITRDPIGEPGIMLRSDLGFTSSAFSSDLDDKEFLSSRATAIETLEMTQLNLYRFVGNNPVNYADPEGLAYKSCTLLSQQCTSSRTVRIGLDVITVCTQRKCKWRCYHDRPDNCPKIPCPDKKCRKDHGVEEAKTYGPDLSKPFGSAPLCKDKEPGVIAAGK